jgi:hypothetical protein
VTNSAVRAEASRLLAGLTANGEWREGLCNHYNVVAFDGDNITAVAQAVGPINRAFIAAAPRLIRALLAEGPDQGPTNKMHAVSSESAGVHRDSAALRADALEDVIVQIAESDEECGCSHDDENCCTLVGVFCGKCIAAQALREHPAAEGPDPETITRLQQLVTEWKCEAFADGVKAVASAQRGDPLSDVLLACAKISQGHANQLLALLSQISPAQESR